MSPKKILEIAERVEARTLAEYRITSDSRRLVYLDRQIDRACVLRCYCWLKDRNIALPRMRGNQ